MSRETYTNFSTPQRSQSQGSMFSIKRWSSQRQQDGEDEILPFRPVKAKFARSYHVTSNDLSLSSTPSLDGYAPEQSTYLRHPVIPERTTSLHTQRNPRWPTRERRAGSIKFDSVPTLTRTPWEVARSERPGSSKWTRTSDRTRNLVSRRSLAQLPQEIYQCIVDHVENARTTREGVDIPGIRQDLLALCRTDRNWGKVAREHLYRDLWLPSNKAPPKKKWSRQQGKSRLRLLQETLRDHPGLAFLVHRIRFIAEVAEEISAEAYSSFRKDSALDLLRDVVQRCYNLERICGNVVPLTTSTIPLFNALATRSRLKEHAWCLNSSKAELPGLDEFIYCHDLWLNLDTLVLAADAGVDLGRIAISAILSRLPALKHLMLSGLDASDFNNATMLVLPALRSLRLENLSGVSDRGVEQLAFTRLAPSLERLKLVDLELASLQTISTLLSHLTRMKALTVVQETSPETQTGGVKFVERGIAFGSTSLKRLHWDCLAPGPALSLFAEGIKLGRFPNLRHVCIPCDYDGVIQALCRPIPRNKLIHNDLEYLQSHSDQYERNLRVSQIQAQFRVRASRQKPAFNFIVQDESNEIQNTHVIGTYLGDMSSKIEYSLRSEAGNAALAGFDDVAWPKRYDMSGVELQQELRVLF